MSADLREAVEAAAVYQFGLEAARLGCDVAQVVQAWDDAKPAVMDAYRESVLGTVDAAAPLIEAQVRAQVAAQIEAERDRATERLEATDLVGFRIRVDALRAAARIARGVK